MEFTKRDRIVDGEPLVSIVIPAYSPRFFAASMDSAMAQTYANIEIVVCDDSEGVEIEAMTRERARHRNVRYLRNPVRLRGRGNFTKCFETARGEFIKFLCDDDLLAPNCVASLLDAFRRAPDITLATSRRRRIDENGNVLEDQPATMPLVAANTTIAGYTLANVMLMAGLNTVGEPTTVLFRKAELLDQAPEYFHFERRGRTRHHRHGDLVRAPDEGRCRLPDREPVGIPQSLGAAPARPGHGAAQYGQHPRNSGGMAQARAL